MAPGAPRQPYRAGNAKHMRQAFTPSILTTAADALRYSRISLIRCALAVPAASRTRPILWSPRSRQLKGPCSNPAMVELASMLPGFRFLFAAIILSMSILIFGLGAAALLRAAHEEFASNPSWHATPETIFAQQGEAARPEASRPVLAMLRVDAPVVEKSADEVPPAAAPAEQAVIPPPPAEPEKTAARKPEDSPPREAATPEIPAPEALAPEQPDIPVSPNPAQDAAAPAAADAPAAVGEKKIAATEQALSPPSETTPAAEAAPEASEPASVAASPGADIAATKIATLGGPPVTIGTRPPARAAVAKPDRDVVTKHLRARQAAQRRRIAARARLARQAPAQPVDPFAQPAPPARSR
jgi:hypothetical protein